MQKWEIQALVINLDRQNYLVSTSVFSCVHSLIGASDERLEIIIGMQGANTQTCGNSDGLHAVGYGVTFN
jgi:hypothetical protein